MIRVEFDTNLFETGMLLAASHVIAGTEAGMQKTMERFKNDALTKPPACPVDTGWMAKHHVTEVSVIGRSIQGTLAIVDTPYAASLHEGISRWGTPYTYKTPGTGMKWIDSKALMYREAYVRKIYNDFVQGLKSWSNRIRGMFK